MTPIARFLKFSREERLDCDEVTYDALPDLHRLVEWFKEKETNWPHKQNCSVWEETMWMHEIKGKMGGVPSISPKCTCGISEIQSLLGDGDE